MRPREAQLLECFAWYISCCYKAVYTQADTQIGHYKPSYPNSTQQHFWKNTVLATAFSETEHLRSHNLHIVSCCSSRRTPLCKPLYQEVKAHPHTRVLKFHTRVKQQLPKESQRPPSCRELLPLLQSQQKATCASTQLLQYIVQNLSNQVPNHIPFAQLCYRGLNCWQRVYFGKQGGVNIVDCCITSVQGSGAHQTCFKSIICENPWVNLYNDPC